MRISNIITLIVVLMMSLSACAAPQTATPTAPAATLPAAPVEPTRTTEPTAVPTTAGSTNDGQVYELVPEKSKANYRITEQLANRDLPNDAIGATTGLTGTVKLLVDGTIDQATSKFIVDLSKLQSDSSMCDNYVRRNILQTSEFPEAFFVPTEIKGLPNPIPQSGSITFQVVGDLTIRDVTKQVIWEVSGTIDNGEALGKATTNFKFADFNLSQPKVPVVLSVEDKIILEVEVAIKPAGG